MWTSSNTFRYDYATRGTPTLDPGLSYEIDNILSIPLLTLATCVYTCLGFAFIITLGELVFVPDAARRHYSSTHERSPLPHART